MWGATCTLTQYGKSVMHFNPRAPCGARREVCVVLLRELRISIHAPRVGRDCGYGRQTVRYVIFQSTRPVWGATNLSFSQMSSMLFQSTRPVWGATVTAGIRFTANSISIHAPRVGRDSDCHRPQRLRMHFNPRAPCGARQKIWEYPQAERYFNPRAPCGARPYRRSLSIRGLSFQSTRPVWGATI